MELKKLNKKGQAISLADAPTVVLIVGLVFLMMATIAYVADQYGGALDDGSIGFNVTEDLQTELGDNTDIAGIVLTIALVGIVLSVLIGIFVTTRRGRVGI